MDPNAAWQHILELAEGISETAEDDPDMIDLDDAADLASHIVDLKEWLNGGGHPPDAFAQ